MKQLVYDVITLCRQVKRGGETTRAQRKRNLLQIARWLVVQHPKLATANLQSRHVQFVVEKIKNDPGADGAKRSIGRQKNMMAALRWWLAALNKKGLLPSENEKLGIPRRRHLPAESRAVKIDDSIIAAIALHCKFAAMSVKLTKLFGLRIAESQKIILDVADHGDYLALRGSWCKGGVPRVVPILNPEQRAAVEDAKDVAQGASLIPKGMSYATHSRAVRRICNQFGVHVLHGARHEYAQERFKTLAGFECPIRGGPTRNEMTPMQQVLDQAARLTISAELGHSRKAISNTYLGSATTRPRPMFQDPVSELID